MYYNHEKEFEIKKYFNPDKLTSKYALYLWCARDELYIAHTELISTIFGRNQYSHRKPWITPLKYFFITLDECLDLIFLKNKSLDKFRLALQQITNDSIDSEIKVISELYRDFLNFFSKIRNFTVHFDHEQNNSLFDDFINQSQKLEIYERNNLPSDVHGNFYVELLLHIYADEFDINLYGEQNSEYEKNSKIILNKIADTTKTIGSKTLWVLDRLLSNYFYIYTDWFEDEPELFTVFVYDRTVSAGDGVYIDDASKFEARISEKPPRNTDYLLKVAGDSMEPDLLDGDYLFVQAVPDVDIGEKAIFSHNGKGFVKIRGKNKMISLNTKYPPIQSGESTSCIGKVLGVYRGVVI